MANGNERSQPAHLSTDSQAVRSLEPKLTRKQKRMRDMVERMRAYMNSYVDQYGYMDYTDDTFIDDVLYGLGISIDAKKYYAASGFEQFKDDILNKKVGK